MNEKCITDLPEMDWLIPLLPYSRLLSSFLHPTNTNDWIITERNGTERMGVSVQQRRAAITKARKLSSALSAASSACDHIRNWVLGTPKGTWVSMGVYSGGSYGLKIDEFSRSKMDATTKELIEEKALAYSCPG